MKIFLVEDSLDIRDRLKSSIIKLGGFEVCGEAINETEAVQRILDLRPDVVILDLALAEGSGIEVLRKINSAFSKIKVIVLSNHSARPYREKCRLLGADHFLCKATEFDLLPDLLLQQRSCT